ncbi:MAG: transporter [Paracoccaceae bacterium]
MTASLRPARVLAALLGACLAPVAGLAQKADLAQELTNPIADLVSVPFQLNLDEGFGEDGDGWRSTLNIQPVYPFSVSDDWNLISRTIVPLVRQENVLPDSIQAGLGDALQSVFLSPNTSGDGLIWGAGLAFGLPTATDDALGSGKWTVGPTAVALRMNGPLTYGALVNHLRSVAGEDGRPDVDQSFAQPFFSYTSPSAVTLTASAEGVYDWERHGWTVPLNLTVARMFDLGGRPVSLQAGLRYWAESPDGGPEGVGLRLGTTFLFPR